MRRLLFLHVCWRVALLTFVGTGAFAGCNFPAFGGMGLSIGHSAVADLSLGKPVKCKIHMSCWKNGVRQVAGTSVSVRLIAPEGIECRPTETTLTLDEHGKAVWEVEFILTKLTSDQAPSVEAIMQHESGHSIRREIDLVVAPPEK